MEYHSNGIILAQKHFKNELFLFHLFIIKNTYSNDIQRTFEMFLKLSLPISFLINFILQSFLSVDGIEKG